MIHEFFVFIMFYYMKNNISFLNSNYGNYSSIEMYCNGHYVGHAEWQYDDVYSITRRFNVFVEQEELRHNDDIAYINTIYIHQDFRGNGFSNLLIRKTLASIRKSRTNIHICLMVESSNRHFTNMHLYRLYQKHKFKRYRNSRYMFIYKRRYKRKKMLITF